MQRAAVLCARLISFPARRDAAGKPLVPLSLDFFRQHKAVDSFLKGDHHPQALDELPARFTRQPLSELEMVAIESGGAFD
eukprot:m.265245 g.265245  ORF g.265245 m.265245 type:complete len:80 (+) comp28814_c0_seq1:37-276(+)